MLSIVITRARIYNDTFADFFTASASTGSALAVELDAKDIHTGALTAGVTETAATNVALVSLQIAQKLNSGVSALENSVVTINFPFSNTAPGTDIWYFGIANSEPMIMK